MYWFETAFCLPISLSAQPLVPAPKLPASTRETASHTRMGTAVSANNYHVVLATGCLLANRGKQPGHHGPFLKRGASYTLPACQQGETTWSPWPVPQT